MDCGVKIKDQGALTVSREKGVIKDFDHSVTSTLHPA